MRISDTKGGDSFGEAHVKALLVACRQKARLYTHREQAFLRDVATGHFIPTAAQISWLKTLAEREEVDFEVINRAALPVLEALCRRWLPDGKLQANEWIALNPTRADARAGSFRVNVRTGRWADFADPSARGGDAVSLAAYLFHHNDQLAAARDVKRMLRA